MTLNPSLFSKTPAGMNFGGRRNDNSSVVLQWTPSPGTTQFSLWQSFPNETYVNSFNFTTTGSFTVSNVIPEVVYLFTLYAGNSFGIDYLNGPSVEVSTLSKPFPSPFPAQSSLSTYFMLALLCYTTMNGNATWPQAVAGQTVCEQLLSPSMIPFSSSFYCAASFNVSFFCLCSMT